MAKCGIICGKYNSLLVSHAGILTTHIPHCLTTATNSIRMWLIKNIKSKDIQLWFHMEGPLLHRKFDISPNSMVPTNIIQEIQSVSSTLDITLQVIGHNYRPAVQKITSGSNIVFLIDTGISRSFGKDTKV